jgi:cation diffusion facilitator CzcD-associated flavoprotein CzcO
MDQKGLKVTIIGAGVGGLCLAQGLKASGVVAEVFERDASPASPFEGYRLRPSARWTRPERLPLGGKPLPPSMTNVPRAPFSAIA